MGEPKTGQRQVVRGCDEEAGVKDTLMSGLGDIG